jgi:hypothetical protein
MGYETEIPPVPTRDQELQMIKKIKKSFQDQPYYKFYMNESLRLRKMEHVKELNKFQTSFTGNFFRGSLFSSFFLLPLALLYRRTGNGVPSFFRPKHFVSAGGWDHVHEFRNLRMMKFFVPAWFLCGYAYATIRTSMEPIMDEYYENKAVVLPY